MTDHKTGLARAVQKAAKEGGLRYKAQNPDAQGLSVKAKVVAFKARSKALRAIPARAVHLFLREPDWIEKSNQDIAAHFQRDIGERVPLNILTEDFTGAQALEVKEALQSRNIELDLKKNHTASKVKLALLARNKVEKAVSFYVKISFASDVVTVGDKAYPIQPDRRIHVGGKKLSVEALRLLIANSK